MPNYYIKRQGTDVVVSVLDNGVEQSVCMPERVFLDIVEDVRGMPEVQAYPVGLEVHGAQVELPFVELERLARQLQGFGLPN